MIYIIDVYHMKGVKRGDGEEEGIYLLAKDLAYNVALDQTEQLTKGIQQLTKKNMHDVSNAINILDTSKGVDKAICKTGAYKFDSGDTSGNEKAEKCGVAGGSSNTGNDTDGGLSLLWKKSSGSSAGQSGGNYEAGGTDKMGPITSGVISKDVTALNREQKGVVSSAGAKT